MKETATIALGRASRATIGSRLSGADGSIGGQIEGWWKKVERRFRESYRLERTDDICIKFTIHFIANNIKVNFWDNVDTIWLRTDKGITLIVKQLDIGNKKLNYKYTYVIGTSLLFYYTETRIYLIR